MADNWILWAFLSASFAAATTILSKVGLRGVDHDAAQLVRTAVVLATVGLIVVGSGRWRGVAAFSCSTWTYLALAGIATAASWICYFRALATGDASRVAAIDKLSVPIIAVVAAVTMAERLGPLGWAGVSLTAVGAMLISLAK